MYCEACGVPVGITRGNTWHADGSISGKHPPYIKGTFFDVDELGYLFRALSELMHYDISDIVASGKYHDAREYMSALMEKMKEASGGTLPSAEELYRMMLYPICIWGIAAIEISSITPEKMVIRVKDPYSIPLLCGDVAGVADVVAGGEHKAVWEGDEKEGEITVIPAPGYAAVSRRIDEVSRYGAKPEAEELACERCQACGAPEGVSGLFSWDNDRCRIEERSSGRRYGFNNTEGISAVLRMLVGELGEEMEQRMEDIAREYSLSLYKAVGQPEGDGRRGRIDLQAQFDSFPLRGWGMVTDNSSEELERSVSIANPYNDTLVTGRIWGMEEASTGIPLDLTGSENDGRTLRLAFSPS